MSIIATIVTVLAVFVAYAATIFGLFASVTAHEYVDDTPRDTPFRLATYDDVPEWVANEVTLEA